MAPSPAGVFSRTGHPGRADGDGHREIGILRTLIQEKVLEALFRPALELIARGSKGGRYFVRLLSQCLAEPGASMQPLVQEEFSEKNLRFHAAMRHALPHLTRYEVHWRLHFSLTAFSCTR